MTTATDQLQLVQSKVHEVDMEELMFSVLGLWPLAVIAGFGLFVYFFGDQLIVWIYLLSGPLSKLIP